MQFAGHGKDYSSTPHGDQGGFTPQDPAGDIEDDANLFPTGEG